MDNNDVMRRMRYILNKNDKEISEIFQLADYQISEEDVKRILNKDGDILNCSNDILKYFLDGVIIYKRGKKEENEEEKENLKRNEEKLTNNVILKKLKIAFDLKAEDMIEIFEMAEVEISKSELSALFRRKDHRNYKECGDSYVRKFLKGLTAYVKEIDYSEDEE